tara:strand:+ start:708 stop:1226 length:519 start_codon:yes stop_codon:yes gene_type:complete
MPELLTFDRINEIKNKTDFVNPTAIDTNKSGLNSTLDNGSQTMRDVKEIISKVAEVLGGFKELQKMRSGNNQTQEQPENQTPEPNPAYPQMNVQETPKVENPINLEEPKLKVDVKKAWKEIVEDLAKKNLDLTKPLQEHLDSIEKLKSNNIVWSQIEATIEEYVLKYVEIEK